MDINSENRDEIIFSYLEGLLEADQKVAFEQLLAADESLQRDVKAFKGAGYYNPEPLSQYVDLTQQISKSKFPSRFLIYLIGGVFIFGIALYAIFNPQNAVQTVPSSSVDSSGENLNQSEKEIRKDSVQYEITRTPSPKEKPIATEKVEQVSVEEAIHDQTNTMPSAQGIPTTTVTAMENLSKAMAKEQLPSLLDTIPSPTELKGTASVKDSTAANKSTKEKPKQPKPRPVNKLKLKGTEEIKTNSSLY